MSVAAPEKRNDDLVITREDKLFMFCVAAFVTLTLLGLLYHSGEIGGGYVYLAYLIGIPFYLAYYGISQLRAAARWLVPAAIVGSLFFFKPVIFTILSDVDVSPGGLFLGMASEFAIQWEFCGIFGLIGIGLLFGIPIYNFHWARHHPDVRMRRIALAGTVFVGIFILSALFVPNISSIDSGLVYVIGIMMFWGELRAREDAWLAEPHQRNATISVGIICKNEADRIGECLSSVAGWADEIIVLDSGSTDGTLTEVRKYTDKVFVTDWPGYGPQKRRVVEKCSMEWVLSIDADEIVTERLKQEIDGVLSDAVPYDGFKFAWRSEIFGGTVDFGADGRRHLRLFRREGTAEFSQDVVHEGVERVARVRVLHGIVIHKTFRNYAHLMNKFMSYAILQSKARYQWGRRAGVYEAAIRGVFSFLSLYIYRLGLLDGWRGLLMAGLYAQYTFNKYAALWVKGLEEPATRQAPGSVKRDST